MKDTRPNGPPTTGLTTWSYYGQRTAPASRRIYHFWKVSGGRQLCELCNEIRRPYGYAATEQHPEAGFLCWECWRMMLRATDA